MPIQLPSTSRFKNTDPVVLEDGTETFGMMKQFGFLDASRLDESDVVELRVDAFMAHRPDHVASKVYGNPRFHWVVIAFNRPADPFMWPEIGDVIRLPARRIVIPEL